MEPRFFKRGNAENDVRFTAFDLRFNGTTLFQTWKSLKNALQRFFLDKLQWNHAFSNVEITHKNDKCRNCYAASMEPRFFKRGNVENDDEIYLTARASMEPRFFKRGNTTNIEQPSLFDGGFNGTTLFQTWK